MQSSKIVCETEDNIKTFGIIGFGLTGVSLFCQLVDKLILNLESNTTHFKIDIFERKQSQFATGQPYQIDCPPIWTLNNPASKLKLLSNGMDMAVWMKESKSSWISQFPNINEEYPPRALVGRYIQDQYSLYKEKAKLYGILIEEQFEEIIDIYHIEDGTWQITSKDNEKFQMDYIFLCLGHVSTDRYSHLRDKKNYFHYEDNINKLKDIPKDEEICIIGGQAAFVDTALWLTYINHHVGNIYTITRNPPIITTKGNNASCDQAPLEELKDNLKINYQTNSMSLSEAKTLFWNTYRKATHNPIDIDKMPTTRSALTYQLAKYDGNPQSGGFIGNVDELRSFIFTFYFSGCYREFWDKLKDEDKDEFNKQFYSHIMAFLTGITPLNARLLLRLYDTSQIQELSSLHHITYDDKRQKFLLHFTDKNIKECKYLIDSSGLGYDVSQCHTHFPLINNLISKGYLIPKQHGGVLLNDHGQVIDQYNQAQQNVFCIGPIASYGNPFPTPYASFIAINAIEKVITKLSNNLVFDNETKHMSSYSKS